MHMSEYYFWTEIVLRIALNYMLYKLWHTIVQTKPQDMETWIKVRRPTFESKTCASRIHASRYLMKGMCLVKVNATTFITQWCKPAPPCALRPTLLSSGGYTWVAPSSTLLLLWSQHAPHWALQHHIITVLHKTTPKHSLALLLHTLARNCKHIAWNDTFLPLVPWCALSRPPYWECALCT